MKYERLKVFLAGQGRQRLRLSFDEIARAAGGRLPASAYKHPAWWANDSISHAQSKAWLGAGYKTAQVDLANQRVEFVRIETPSRGVRETNEVFQSQSAAPLKKHPMAGALKGTFTIAIGWDLTKASLDEDELAAWDRNLDRKANMIDAGLRGKRS